jgi:hypothetical protein
MRVSRMTDGRDAWQDGFGGRVLTKSHDDRGGRLDKWGPSPKE